MKPSLCTRKTSVIALAALVLTAGCVKQDDPGLEMVALDADIVFGIEAAPAAVEPVGFVAPRPVEQRPALEPPAVEELPELTPRIPQPVLPPPPAGAKFLCPTAGLGEFPASAPVDVTTTPKIGTYLWRPGPPTLVETSHFDVKPSDLFSRIVFNVSPVNETADPSDPTNPDAKIRSFTYQMATYSGSSVTLDTYRVVSGGIYTSVGAINFGPSFYTGQPDRGVSLVSRDVIENGRVVASFSPSTPVLLLPLPAISGSTFQSVSYDPVYGTTYMIYGEVKQRARVDACGKEVDGWEVVAQTALRDPRDGPTAPPRTANLRYFVATGAGGLLSYESRTPLELPRFPVNGTPADGATPPNPDVPDTPANAEAYEFSLASRDPGPITQHPPTPTSPLSD
ncbi:MAG TPA: hypothetical protein VF230_01945 [Acidimicrobiales bacterium]